MAPEIIGFITLAALQIGLFRWLKADIQETRDTLRREIDGLRREIDGLRREVDGIKEDIKEINRRIDAINQRIDETNNRLDETNRRLDATNQRIDDLYNIVVTIGQVPQGERKEKKVAVTAANDR